MIFKLGEHSQGYLNCDATIKDYPAPIPGFSAFLLLYLSVFLAFPGLSRAILTSLCMLLCSMRGGVITLNTYPQRTKAYLLVAPTRCTRLSRFLLFNTGHVQAETATHAFRAAFMQPNFETSHDPANIETFLDRG